MIASLRFNLPEEQSDFNDACDGSNLRQSLLEFDQYLRGIAKHAEHPHCDFAQQDRDKLHEILSANKVSI